MTRVNNGLECVGGAFCGVSGRGWTRFRSLLWPLAAIFLISGCAYGSRTILKASPRLEGPAPLVIAVADDRSTTSDDAEALARAVLAKLDQSGRRARLQAGPGRSPSGDSVSEEVRVVLEITGIKRVTQSERALIGAFAGRAWVRVRVRLNALPSGELLGEADFEGFSSGGTIFAGTTRQAIDEASTKIAEFIVGG